MFSDFPSPEDIAGLPIDEIPKEIEFPFFYLVLRIGQRGRLFYECKIRTLKKGSGKTHEQVYVNGKPKYDPRTNLVGNFVRKMGIDEIPQLIINVWRDRVMNIVGPRPISHDDAASIGGYDLEQILAVKPGLVGMITVRRYMRIIGEKPPEEIEESLYARAFLGYLLQHLDPKLQRIFRACLIVGDLILLPIDH